MVRSIYEVVKDEMSGHAYPSPRLSNMPVSELVSVFEVMTLSESMFKVLKISGLCPNPSSRFSDICVFEPVSVSEVMTHDSVRVHSSLLSSMRFYEKSWKTNSQYWEPHFLCNKITVSQFLRREIHEPSWYLIISFPWFASFLKITYTKPKIKSQKWKLEDFWRAKIFIA